MSMKLKTFLDNKQFITIMQKEENSEWQCGLVVANNLSAFL